MTKEILVLGNGFDIYHGLRTRYTDFIEYTRIKAKEDPACECATNPFIQYFQYVCKGNGNWIDCELELERVIRSIRDFLGLREIYQKQSVIVKRVALTPISLRVIKFFDHYFSIPKSATAYHIDKKYIIEGGILNENLLLEDLKRDWDVVIKILNNYLRLVIDSTNVNKRSPQLKKLKNIIKVVTFNYTNLYSIYGIRPELVFSPHGSLDNLNSMVFGMPDAEDIDLDYIYFKKYFQRIQKHTGLLSLPYTNSWDEMKNVISYFFGMSMGKADEDYIKRIVAYCRQSVILYYSQKDFEDKVINLIDIYGRAELEEYINGGKIIFEKMEDAITI